MSLHDLYLISPQLAVAGVGVLVILLDLLVPRKDVLPVVAFIGLVVPLLLLLHQVSITGAPYTLLVGSSEFQADALQGSFSLDKFSLFFNFLILGSVALVILALGGLCPANGAVPWRVLRVVALLSHGNDAAGFRY